MASSGLRNRAVGGNTVNEHSSRSHSILTIHIDSDLPDQDDEKLFIVKHGKLTFVDLAGTHTLSPHNVFDIRYKYFIYNWRQNKQRTTGQLARIQYCCVSV